MEKQRGISLKPLREFLIKVLARYYNEPPQHLNRINIETLVGMAECLPDRAWADVNSPRPRANIIDSKARLLFDQLYWLSPSEKAVNQYNAGLITLSELFVKSVIEVS